MLLVRDRRAVALGVLGLLAIAIALAALVERAEGTAPKKAPATPAPAPPETAIVRSAISPETPANLQTAFTNEMNAKQRYIAFAKVADRDGYPGVASLFRACAQAEDVHASRHVHAIAYTGEAAQAKLERVAVGTTEENLKVSIGNEDYEANTFYPEVMARARAAGESEAVRSVNLALAAEREHAKLLTAALEHLNTHAPVHTYFVCPYCGKTVESLSFEKCPNCFTKAGKFIKVS